MPRIIRNAHKGSLLHIIFRSISQKGIWSTDPERRYFLSLIARLARTHRIRVISYSVMTNHVHLLVVCLDDDISSAMQFLANCYSRWYNRRHSRTGPLYSNRYFSKLVDTEEYFRAVVRYIDFNPVKAGMCKRPEDHKFGSAKAWHSGRFLPWLDQSRIGEFLRPYAREGDLQDAYKAIFSSPPTQDEQSWVEGQRLAHQSKSSDAKFLKWFEQHSESADGKPPLNHHIRISIVVKALTPGQIDKPSPYDKKIARTPIRDLFLAATLHDLAGLPLRSISNQLRISRQAVDRRIRRHRELLHSNSDYSGLYRSLTGSIIAEHERSGGARPGVTQWQVPEHRDEE